jgi:PadR family transcriptional regulator, regulatory protein AphA
VKLSSASYVVLGMLSVGARSGYEVRRFMELSARFFWALSPVQIYPELKRLEEAGLVSGRDEPRGKRARRLYRLTPAGRRALREWLARPEELTVEWRDMGLLRLFFADVLDEERALEQLRAFGARSERLAEDFRERIVPAAEATAARRKNRYSALVARFGRDFNEWAATWAAEAEREMRDAP